MDSFTTENMSMDIDSTNAVDASIMSTVDMMQSCTLRDSGDDTHMSEQAQDVDMDVDTPTNETREADEMNIDSPQYEHIKYEVRLSTPFKLQNPHPNSPKASSNQHDISLRCHHSPSQSRPHFRTCSQTTAQAP
jgi:hypothetical protein